MNVLCRHLYKLSSGCRCDVINIENNTFASHKRYVLLPVAWMDIDAPEANFHQNRHSSITAAKRLCSVLQSPLEVVRTRFV